MSNTILADVLFYNMRTVIENDGSLVPIESNYDIPFPIKRIFYVYGAKDTAVRGEHAHRTTKQLLICVHGKIEVLCDDGVNNKKYLLETPQQGLFIPEMIWDEQRYLSEDSVLLVIANTKYKFDDYIYNYDEFRKLKNE